MKCDPLPTVIQGGMGVAISSWSLARAVSQAGQLGVVSGTALDVVLARQLEVGDPGGHMRRALEAFPIPGVAERLLKRYFVEGGKPDDKPFRSKPMPHEKPSRHLVELTVAANFVEVFLANEGHDGMVGINFLEKIQVPTLPCLYGAMLAGVDCILMGAGIPRAIPGILDRLAEGKPVELRLDVKGLDRDEEVKTHFDPRDYFEGELPALARPDFIAIISFPTLAIMLARKASGRVDGFIVEGSTAGGHNAPPRGKLQLTEAGEPLYGERDIPDLEKIAALGLPFWMAGSYAEPEQVTAALAVGATGVQIGTAFAYCEESGLAPDLKARVLAMSQTGEAKIFTDPVASPTGFPFKVVQIPATNSDATEYEKRTRICDLGYLRHAYKTEDGRIAWRCPSEPVDDYVRKGGDIEDTRGRKCVCNGLIANIDLGQVQRNGEHERALVTSGDDVENVARFLKPGADSYSAVDVIEYLLRDAG